MLTRNNAFTAATLLAGAALVGGAANATPANANKTGLPAEQAVQSNPSASWLGRQAVASDGRVLGSVTNIIAGETADRELLVIRSPFDHQKFRVPAGLAKLDGDRVVIAASASDLQVRGL